MTPINARGIEYELVCADGEKVGAALARVRDHLVQRVAVYQDSEDRDGATASPKLRAEISNLHDDAREKGIAVSRHVGHCVAGCWRLTPFSGVTSGYDRAPHRSKPDLPATSVLAARVRDGESLDFIAAEYERHVGTITQRLATAGYGTDGVARRQPRAPREAPERLLPQWEPWRDQALCAQTDPEAFFPEKGGSTREAKTVCARCPVAAECLDYALTNQERFGVFGGLSDRERRKLHALITDQETS